jgi:hypothetical protein
VFCWLVSWGAARGMSWGQRERRRRLDRVLYTHLSTPPPSFSRILPSKLLQRRSSSPYNTRTSYFRSRALLWSNRLRQSHAPGTACFPHPSHFLSPTPYPNCLRVVVVVSTSTLDNLPSFLNSVFGFQNPVICFQFLSTSPGWFSSLPGCLGLVDVARYRYIRHFPQWLHLREHHHRRRQSSPFVSILLLSLSISPSVYGTSSF